MEYKFLREDSVGNTAPNSDSPNRRHVGKKIEMPVIECELPNLYEELRKLLDQIPRGRVTTYGDLARALGSSSAARWVGEYMRDHPHSDRCHCHRVVRRTGEVGLYISGEIAQKRRKLQDELVIVTTSGVDLDRHRFDDFRSQQPLVPLVEFQQQLPELVSLEPFANTPELVAGVDVSYTRQQQAVGAYALVESAGGRLVWSTTVRCPVTFPYIPGFLAFRENPVLLELIQQADRYGRLAGLIFVDGNGILHPRRAGIASHLGVVADVRTIGIGKKLLCGRVDLNGLQVNQTRRVIYEESLLGMAVKAKMSFRPVFVSPGHRIDVAGAARMAQSLFHGHRLPEPLYWADRLSRNAARDNVQND